MDAVIDLTDDDIICVSSSMASGSIGVPAADVSPAAAKLESHVADEQGEQKASIKVWPKLLRTINVEAISTTRSTGKVCFGDILVFSEMASSKDKKRHLMPKKKRQVEDVAIRFVVRKPSHFDEKNAQGVPFPLPPPVVQRLEIGKLSSSQVRSLQPLLKRKLIALSGEVLFAPASLGYSTTFYIKLHVFALPALFEAHEEVLNESQNVFGASTVEVPFGKMIFDMLKMLRISGHVSTVSDSDDREQNDLINRFHLDTLYKSAQEEYLYLPERIPPDTFKATLRGYQKQALEWMTRRETDNHKNTSSSKKLHPLWKKCDFADGSSFYINPYSLEISNDFPEAVPRAKGGILADQMGMGKTVETIALICNVQPEEESECRQTLVVCTMSLLAQWRDEIEEHSELNVALYYGVGRNASFSSDVDVVITTYQTLSSDHVRNPNSILFRSKWFRVVLDEAHHIKNRSTGLAKSAFALEAESRWCLSGTPIQNRLEDLFSLLHFLREEPWGNIAWWSHMIQKPFLAAKPEALVRLQTILHPLMLRRTKDGHDAQGRPYLDLPDRDDQVVLLDLTEIERKLYTSLFTRSRATFEGLLAKGVVLKSYMHCLELLLRLRQVCDHPFLILPRERSENTLSNDVDHLIRRFRNRVEADESLAISQKFITNLTESLKENIDSIECPICLDVPADPVLTKCGHTLCRECTFGLFNSSGSAMCPLCRTTILRNEMMSGIASGNDTMVNYKQNWQPSSKTNRLIQELSSFRENDPTAKTVVFSQWTSMLDLCEIALNNEEISFLRLDGALRQSQRERAMAEFRDSDAVVLLCSLKVGGVGLNLTMASNVILMDIWWNPAVDEQAIDRVHRIGQNKKVNVRRFVVQESVEQRVLELQQKKKALASGALSMNADEDQAAEAAAARIENLAALFRPFA